MDPNKVAAKFSIRSTFSHTFSNISKNLRIFIIMSCIIVLTPSILILSKSEAFFYIIFFIVYLASIGMITHAISLTNEGKPSSIMTAIARTVPRIPALVGLVIVIWIGLCLIIGLPYILIIKAVPLEELSTNPILIALMLFLSIFLLTFLVILSMTFIVILPVRTMEKTGIIKSIRRSAELTKGNRIKVFFALFLISLIAFVFLFILQVLSETTPTEPSFTSLGEVYTYLGILLISWILLVMIAMFNFFFIATAYFELKAVKGDAILAEEENELQFPQ